MNAAFHPNLVAFPCSPLRFPQRPLPPARPRPPPPQDIAACMEGDACMEGESQQASRLIYIMQTRENLAVILTMFVSSQAAVTIIARLTVTHLREFI